MLKKNNVAGLLTAQGSTESLHVFQDKAISDLGGVVDKAISLARYRQPNCSWLMETREIFFRPSFFLSAWLSVSLAVGLPATFRPLRSSGPHRRQRLGRGRRRALPLAFGELPCVEIRTDH